MEYLTKRFDNTREGLAAKDAFSSQMAAKGYRIISEQLEKGNYKGGEACCRFVLCTPCVFFTSREVGTIAVTYGRDMSSCTKCGTQVINGAQCSNCLRVAEQVEERVADAREKQAQFEKDVLWLVNSDDASKLQYLVDRISVDSVVESRAGAVSKAMLSQLDLIAMKSGLDRIADAKAQLEKCERDRDIFNAELKQAFEERRDEWFTRKGRLFVNLKRIALYFAAFICSLTFLMVVTSFSYLSNLTFWVVSMLFTAVIIVAGELNYAPKRKRAWDASRYYAKNVNRVQDIRAAVQNAQQCFRRSVDETFSSVLKQSFDQLYVEKDSIDALRSAVRAKEQEYPSSCRIQNWPSDTDSGLKEKIEAMTLSIAFRGLLEKSGIDNHFANLL